MSKNLVAAAALLMLVESVWAYKPAWPISYTTTSPDGQHIFVMLSGESMEDELKRWNEQTQARVRPIRQTWQQSGMYRNDGSREPLWTVDWYAFVVSVPSGGDHVVRFTSGGMFWNGQPALAFYRRGELIRQYEIAYLMTFSWLSDHGGWLSDHRLSDDSHRLTVLTDTGDRCVFDVQTGEMVWAFRPIRWALAGIVVLGVLAVAWRVRRRQRRNTKVPPHASQR